MKLLKRYHIAIFLSMLALLSFLLRFYLLPSNLFFGPEQGIDLLVVRDIVINHKFTLIGPKTDIEGVFHGPLYYYVAAVPFLISNGNPLFVAGFFIFLQSLTVFLLYLLGMRMFTQRAGLIAAILFTFSFESIVFARWLANPPLSIPLSCLFFLFLHSFLKGGKNRQVAILAAALTFGLLGQVEFVNFVLFFGILVCVIILFLKEFKKQRPLFHLLTPTILLLSSLGTFALFDLRHDFLMSRSLAGLITQSSGYYTSFPQSFFSTLKIFATEFTKTVVPFYTGIALVIMLLGLILLFRNRSKEGSLFVLIWFLVPLILLVLLRHQVLEQLFVALIATIILLTAFVIDAIWRRFPKVGIIVLLSLLCIQAYSYITYIPKNKMIFFQTTQPRLRYADQIKVIDQIYKRANGAPFSYQAYTIPYWKQDAWDYLFWYRGERSYGYRPKNDTTPMLFVIIQRDVSDNIYQSNWIHNDVETWGVVEETFKQGVLEVRRLRRRV